MPVLPTDILVSATSILYSINVMLVSLNKVFLEGIKTVKLVDPQHSSVPVAVEPLMVVANLFLQQPTSYLVLHWIIQQTSSEVT